MKVENPPICNNIEEYVKKAVELANLEPKKMLYMKNYYKKKANDFLYENEHFIEEMNTLFIDLFNENEKTSI